MDWTAPLKAQQTDFIQRLKSAKLLHCAEKGQHSELTVISGQRLDQLRDFCWEMAEKYRRTSRVAIRDVFINNMKGKLAEEVVKSRLADFVTEVDYEKRVGGDGKVDFTLTSDSSIGIQVKARNGNFDKIQWSISREEIEKNAVLVCILIQEEVSEAQAEYNLIFAGFLPTNMITSNTGKALVGIDKLLYSGGLRSYLESLTSSEADEYIRLYHECLEKEDYGGAFDYFYADVMLLKPNNAYAYYSRGIARSELGDTQGAIEDYTQAINIDSNCVDAYYSRGIARSELGDKQGEIEDYTQAINIDPNYVNAYYSRGIARSEVGDKQGAIDDYTQAIKIPNYVNAYFNRGNARDELGDKQGAIDDYNQALKINPNYAGAYTNRGNARSNLGDKQGAIDDYNQALKINSNDADAYNNRGLVRNELGDKQGAIDDFNLAIKFNPNLAQVYNNRGVVRYDLGDNQEAIADYNLAIKINPNLAQAYNNRAKARNDLGNKQGAIDDFNLAIKINPNYANAYIARGIVRDDLGDKQGAIKDFQTAANIYKKEGKETDYQKVMEIIREINK
jgi:tetratricopeptide (TPR) repeat protein